MVSESSSTANSAVRVAAVAAFFVAIFADLLSWRMKPKWGRALVYVSSFHLQLLTLLVFISADNVYAYSILFVPVTIGAAILLQHKLWPGIQRQSMDDAVNQDHLDFMFKLSALILNWDSNSIITMFITISKNFPSGLNKYSYIASNIAVLFFISTIILSLFLMMVATVRTSTLTVHATYLNVLLVIMLLSSLIATSITFIYNFDQATEGEVPT